jgi:hypothetical protein
MTTTALEKLTFSGPSHGGCGGMKTFFFYIYTVTAKKFPVMDGGDSAAADWALHNHLRCPNQTEQDPLPVPPSLSLIHACIL